MNAISPYFSSSVDFFKRATWSSLPAREKHIVVIVSAIIVVCCISVILVARRIQKGRVSKVLSKPVGPVAKKTGTASGTILTPAEPLIDTTDKTVRQLLDLAAEEFENNSLKEQILGVLGDHFNSRGEEEVVKTIDLDDRFNLNSEEQKQNETINNQLKIFLEAHSIRVGFIE